MQKKAENKSRIGWLDAWKGFAILLVVLGHIADGYLDAGLFAENTNVLQGIYDVIYSFHMPLFFVLSGYSFFLAYASHGTERGERFRLQLWNIAAVYVLFSVIQWVFKMLFAGQVNSTYTLKNLLMLPVRTMAPYWYLYVLFFLYAFVWFVEKGKQPEGWKLVFFLGLNFLSELIPGEVLFEIKRTLYYGVFFYAGVFLAKVAAPVFRERFSGFLSWHSRFPKAGVLRWIGGYSLEIYVLHCFITAANRLILLKLGITNFYCNVFVNLAMATLLPILAAELLKRMKLHGLFFKPVTTIKKLTKPTSVK